MRTRSLLAAGWAAALCAMLAAGVAAQETVVSARLSATATQATVEVTIAPGWHVNSHAPRDEFLIPTSLTLTPPPAVRAGEIAYPAPVERRLAFGGGKTFLLYEGTLRLTAPLGGAGTGTLRAALRYQACDDTRCLPPRTLELATALGAATAPPGTGGSAENQLARWVERWGYPLTFLWVALLGVALNLTPCVYPLISVTVTFFGGRTAGEGRSLGRALLYVLGICLTFSALGTAAAMTGSLFGAALQRPAVLIAIAVLLVALAASNFGLYQLRFPAAVTQRLGRAGEGALGAFVMGLTMGVVAAPCIGPVVVALLLFVGAEQSPVLGFALFFVLGLGMGLPYVGLAALAGRLRRLPRAGAWLESVEQVFGFLLLGLALYFAAPILPAGVERLLTAGLLVSAGVVLGFLAPSARALVVWGRRAGGLALAGAGLAGFLGAATPGVAWEPFSDTRVSEAAAAGRPVFIDVEAEWCLPCREMDHTTFRDPGFVRLAGAFAMLKVDVTHGDEAANALMQRFGVLGVPTYILLGPDGQEHRRFVGFVPAGEMVPAMRAALPADGA